MVWVVLLAAALAVLVVGLVATVAIVGNLGSLPAAPGGFWPRLVVACIFTVGSLGLRSLRWIYLLRRAETRIPIRDAYIGYFAGFSLLFVPFLIGEIAVRATILRSRGNVPALVTGVLNIWERLVDLAALATIAVAVDLLSGTATKWNAVPLTVVGLLFVPAVRGGLLDLLTLIVGAVTRREAAERSIGFLRLARTSTFASLFAVSLVVWLLPGAGLWLVVNSWSSGISIAVAERVYAAATAFSGLSLAPAGVLVVGPQILGALELLGVGSSDAVLTVFAVRLATVGVSLALGVMFVIIHVRSRRAESATHFDDIADAYDVQIPESRRHALLERKTALMREVINGLRVGRRGLDVGCGQGAYVARMRELGFDVRGIDFSGGQVALAARNVGDSSLVNIGSVLSIPAADESFDFLYIINVLHHLGSVEEQRRAFVELFRVLTPGGLLFVHEINTRNIAFRFYMGYVFPSLNCIDEGIERWLLPHKLGQYTSEPVVDIRYFTFLPDFIPQAIARWLAPLERALETSSLAPYSAHYMAVLKKARSA
jgi:ubiquinone/menaquinone biosynthesis C-methylase UbiE